jgi:transposase
MVDFGWSASCLLEAIRLSNKIRKALQDAGGAKEQYEEAISFLTQSDCVFKELEKHIRDNHGSAYREAIVQQLKLMETPWRRLQISLSKYESSLGDKATKSKLSIVSRKVQWALKDLNEAVGKARIDVLGPLQMVSCLLQMHSM